MSVDPEARTAEHGAELLTCYPAEFPSFFYLINTAVKTKGKLLDVAYCAGAQFPG